MERKKAKRHNRTGAVISLTLILIMNIHTAHAAVRGSWPEPGGRYLTPSGQAVKTYTVRTAGAWPQDIRMQGGESEFESWVRPQIKGMIAVYGRENIKYIFMSDFELMAKTVYAEAKSEEYAGQVAVAEVILNRAESENFPDTIEGVIGEEGAFTSWENGAVRAAPLDDECMEAVQDALNERIFPGEVVYFREGRFHTFGTPYTTIGNHYFSTE